MAGVTHFLTEQSFNFMVEWEVKGRGSPVEFDITTLCGKHLINLSMEDHYVMDVYSFMQIDTEPSRCPDCENHPDIPLLYLADLGEE